jgi:predicted nucleic acid-binding protein
VLDAVYELGARRIATAVEMLLGHQQLVIERGEVVAAALAHFRRKPTLGLGDCLILEAARSAGHGPLGTFDRALARLEGAALVPSPR